MAIVSSREWADPACRALARPGSILIDYKGDCYCFPVKEVHPDGVLAWYVDKWKRFTWDELTEGRVALYEQIDPALIRYCGPTCRERGGRINDLKANENRYDGIPIEDLRLAQALASVLSAGAGSVELRAECPDGQPPLPMIDLSPLHLPVTREIRDAVSVLHAAFEEKQLRPWTALAFTLDKAAEGWRYGAEFGYE
jgi:hypothetical protein